MKLNVTANELGNVIDVKSSEAMEITVTGVMGVRALAIILAGLISEDTPVEKASTKKAPTTKKTPTAKKEESKAEAEAEEPKLEKPVTKPKRKKKVEAKVDTTMLDELGAEIKKAVLSFFTGEVSDLSPFCSSIHKAGLEKMVIMKALSHFHPDNKSTTIGIPDEDVPAVMEMIVSEAIKYLEVDADDDEWM